MAASSPKHLALVGPFHPYRGGIAHFLEALYRGMGARGHEVEAVTFRRQYPELLFPGKSQFETSPVADPIEAPRLLDTINPWTWFSTASHLGRRPPDAVLFKFWMPYFAPAFGTIARRLAKKGTRVLAVVDNAIPHERRIADRSLSRWFLGACDGLIVMSDSVQRDLQTLSIDRPGRRVDHPIYDVFGDPIPKSTARQRLDLPADAPVALFFGYVRHYKGLHVLLESMPAVLERLGDLTLVVAGEFYEDEKSTRATIERLGLGSRVRVCADYIPNDQIPAYFSAADVVVQPYVSATQSGVAQIAYHFERPVIITDVGGLAEIVPDGEAGLVVPPKRPDLLSVAIVRFFEESLEERLTAGVRREKQRYSWDRMYEAVEELMEG